MCDLNYLIETLRPHELYFHQSHSLFSPENPPELLDGETVPVPAAGILYLGETEQTISALHGTRFSQAVSATFLVAKGADFPMSSFYDSPHNILVTDLSLADLFRRVANVLAGYAGWERCLNNLLGHGLPLPDLLGQAAGQLGASLLLFTPGFHLLACGEAADAPLSDIMPMKETVENRFLSRDIQKKLPPLWEAIIDSPISCRLADHELLLLPLRDRDLPAALLLCLPPARRPETDLRYALRRLGGCLGSRLSGSTTPPSKEASPFQELVNDLNGPSSVSDAECEERISALLPPNRYIRCLLVTLPDGTESSRKQAPSANEKYFSASGLLQALAELFPDCPAALFGHQIVLLYSCERQSFTPPEEFHSATFLRLLEEYQAQAILSNGSSRYHHFRTFYELCRRLSPILAVLHPRERICHYAEYADYLVIDLAYHRFREDLGHSDIITLTDPCLIALTRYDYAHDTNLREVLYAYLRNGRNIARTGEEMYMHRNTVQNKIHRITEILRVDLTDGSIQQRLLFSCRLIRYYEGYLQRRLEL
ncbi:MAG: helix-turn-helix domain-containing protein [Lachnospiraceae bacterium]|nr:helix-turn-helix domain-containing protein [Lachnospiraceae bacterium]